ncbi:MAG: ABC transporter substrate-binding protein [Candidatus Komeilibacteria bacterium]|nr:ABC transporter substrate-binding protein [Candidatus Komeilibacteria bacterium]
MIKKKLLLVPLLVALVFVLTGCGKNKEEAKQEQTNQPQNLQTIKLGVIAPLSGDAGVYGQEVQKVLDYDLPEINSKAATLGKKFELVYEDGKCAGPEAVTAFHKLVDVDGIKFIIGGMCSSETLAVAPLTKDSTSVLTTAVMSSNPAINGISPFSFTFSANDDDIGKMLAKLMSGYKKIAIITEQNDYNIGVKKVWEKALDQYPEVKIVASETVPKGASDFRTVLGKIKKTQPEAIFLNPNGGVTAKILVKQMDEMGGWQGIKLYSSISYIGEDTLSAAPSITDGMTIVDAPKLTSPEFLSLKQKIETTPGSLSDIGDFGVAVATDNLTTVTNLILELGENPQVVRDALAARTFQGYVGKIYFGNNSFPDIAPAIFIVKDGKPVLQK